MNTRVVSFPAPIDRNPYQALLYRHLKDRGVEVGPPARLSVGWLRENRACVTTLHFHWPEYFYRFDRGPHAIRGPLSWVRLGLFVARLTAARRFGYRIVWTVHQLSPHESSSRKLDRVGTWLLARASHVLIALDRSTANRLAAEFRWSAANVRVIPHGSYIGVYPRGRSRAEVRAELGISRDAFVVLSFGQIRKYKQVDVLVAGFRGAGIAGGTLVVAGLPLDGEESRRLAEAARAGGEIVTVLQYVPDERVAELFDASDVAVITRSDGGTSGAAVLALSMGVPIVAPSLPAYEELTGGGRAGWHFDSGDAESLVATLRLAAADPAARAEKARSALGLAECLAWPEIAAQTAAALRPD
jgi:beta-1,4-mannosyltransferase